MIETGDFVRIRFQEEPRHKKPIGIYWLQVGAAKAFGGNAATERIWPYRIPSFLGATLAVLLTFALGRSLVGVRPALLGAAIAAGSLLLIFEAHQATTDAALLATVVASQGSLGLLYIRNRSGMQAGNGIFLTFWIAQGIGILLKGPIVPLVAALTIISLVVADRKGAWLKGLRPMAGLCLTAAIVLPWAVAVTRATEGAFFHDAVRNDLLPKLISGQESHGFTPGYYLLLLPVTFWPGSAYLGMTLGSAWKNRLQISERFLLAWIIPAWILFELVPTKLPHYVMPTYPALALLTAKTLLEKEGDSILWPRYWPRWTAIALGCLVGLVLAVGIPAIPWFLDDRFDPLTLWPAACAVLVIVFVVRSILRNRPVESLTFAIIGSVLIFAPTFQRVLPHVDALWLSRTIVQEISEHDSSRPLAPNAIVAAGYHEPSLVFLAGTRTGLVSAEEAASFLRDHPGALAIVSEREEKAFQKKLADLNISAHLIKTIRGFHYSKGRKVTLRIYTRRQD